MILVHYGKYINIFPGKIFAKVISYTDFAVEGFIFIAGYSIGKYYYGIFITDRRKIIGRLLKRAFQILKIHYVMICTISVPLAIILGDKILGSESFKSYIINSFLLLNQVGLLHILPTFIPLFLLAIPVLFLFEKKLDVFVLVLSFVFFAWGNYSPYVFNLGQKTIFPVILWQIYFVAGIFAGKQLKVDPLDSDRKNVATFLGVGLLLFGVMSLIYFGHHFFPVIGTLKNKYNIVVSKFPLNVYGLLYRGSILCLVICGIFFSWSYIVKAPLLKSSVALIGKYSLVSFIIHVYFVKLLVLLENIFRTNILFDYSIIMANLLCTLIVLTIYERKCTLPSRY